MTKTIIFAVISTIACCSLAFAADQSATSEQHCGNVEEAQTLVTLIKADPQQQRSELRCNALLTQLALEKAKVMAEHGLVMQNLNGSPNSHLRNGGYQLPDYYGGMMSNQVEAIAGGYHSAEEVWRAFKQSTAHRQHLLGELTFYREQDEIGVGFFRDKNAPHVQYWVVYVSKGHRANQKTEFTSDQIPNKSMFESVLKTDK
ncbi:CAP domain-containing protein [Thalassotalea mangrovi]|uniref:CAP domain-containing protein n=1 Tax=Thalassotalea mangrovi TaxID=2572245 RepID=A0A4U1BAX0_9GAMM|nr:CAP domain-containing protein [Thalassotalea mangrovi]TKB47860.1 CAP domain-containing protein [Thalassotalea mangrovi]